MFVFEDKGKHNGHYQCIGCKREPCGLPLGRLRHSAVEVHKVVHHRLCTQRSDGGTQSVGHDDEQALGARADSLVRLTVNEQRARYVEEVESHSIDNHREQEHPDAAAWVARAEQAEAQHPCEHGDEHHPFDAEALQAERYQQDAERLRYLRQRDQDIGMLHAEGVGIFRYAAEAADVRVGKSVGDLQRHAQQHGEDEEDGHFLLLEQGEGAQAQRFDQRFALSSLACGAGGQSQGIASVHQADDGTGEELSVVVLQAQDVHQPHGADESDGPKDTDRGEVLDGVQSCLIQRRIGYGVRKSQGRHIEGYAQGIEAEERSEFHVLSACHAIVAGESHEDGSHEVAEAQKLLGRYPAVGYDTHNGWHEE